MNISSTLPEVFVSHSEDQLIVETLIQDHFWLKVTATETRMSFEHHPKSYQPEGNKVSDFFVASVDEYDARFVRLVLSAMNDYMNDSLVKFLEAKQLLDRHGCVTEDSERACAGVTS